MAIITRFFDKNLLIIEDAASMRTQLQLSLATFGFNKLRAVSNIKDALSLIEKENYDIFLCDYNLGERTNGQQFLEHLRMHDLISRHSLFIMITGESNYSSVVLAAECSPDDYLLKPFSGEDLNVRLESLLERREIFAVIDHASDAKDWATALAECERIISARDRYYLYACKIRGALLLKLERAQDAADHYRQVLKLRPLGWAKLGLAKACGMLGEYQEAEELSREVLQESPQFTTAYDFLGELLTTKGEKESALQVLQKAREISPGTLSRIRNMSTLALQTGRYEMAEEVMQEALSKHKYSPVREASDFVLFSKALIEQGKGEKALQALKEGKESFNDASSKSNLAASESIVHHKLGNHERAAATLAEALAADSSQLSAQAVAGIAEACLSQGQEEKAYDLLKQAIQNNPDDPKVREQVHAVLSSAGKGAEEADAIIDASVKEVIKINNDGVLHAEAGELEEAIVLLSNAADRLPNNLQIVSNAALVLALDLVRHTFNPNRLRACLKYREIVTAKDPEYPKLAQIDALLKQVKKS